MKLKCIAIACGLVLTVAAHADTVLTYTFSSDATFDLDSGNTYAATGTFGYDVTTGAVVDVAYSAIQSGTGPAGPFNFTVGTAVSSTDVVFTNDGAGDVDEYFFAQSLALGGTSAITGAAYAGSTITGSGSVTAAAAVPEPASWGLMLAGLVVMGRRLRRQNRAR